MMRPILTCLLLVLAVPARAEVVELPTGAFEFTHEIVVPGTPGSAWDEFTGDVSGWWDHHQSADPVELVIEGRPGGHFYERFDEAGNGCIHADIIFADRGRKLVMSGPLGLSGHAVNLVTTVEFVADGPQRVRVTVTCRAAGEVLDGWPETVERVWYHFLVEQFQPWMEAVAHGG